MSGGKIQNASNGLYFHFICYRNYMVQRSVKKKNDSGQRKPGHAIRKAPFDYMMHYLICAEEIDFDNVRHHPEGNEIQITEYVE